MQASSNKRHKERRAVKPRVALAVALGGWSGAPNQMAADMEGSWVRRHSEI